MNFHPHIHAIVLGGGLDVKNHWKDNGKDFFLPIKVISKTFRGKDETLLKPRLSVLFPATWFVSHCHRNERKYVRLYYSPHKTLE